MRHHFAHRGRPVGVDARRSSYVVAAAFAAAATVATEPALAQTGSLELTSPLFGNGDRMPLSTIGNVVQNGANVCTASGIAGGDQSPPLDWQGVPDGTRSFTLVVFDPTASFTHWGIYNIPRHLRSLPQNAGAPGSTGSGTQVVDDAGVAGYFGPCPPANVPPDRHRYVFTLYALDGKLKLGGSANFPANSETLYQALISAGIGGHILATATLTGYYSSTPR